MFRNYLVIAYRNLKHNRIYTLINVFGLGIGLTAALFIFQYVQFEYSYDNFHKNADQLYRVIQHLTINGLEEAPEHFTPSLVAPILKHEVPGVIDYARLNQNFKTNFILSYVPEDGRQPVEYMERKVYYADASLLHMFTFPMVAGDPEALKEPNTIMLSENMADKIFGKQWPSEMPIGKFVNLNGEENLMVRGIFRNIPVNSSLRFEALISVKTLKNIDLDTATRDSRMYLQLTPGTDIDEVENKLTDIVYGAMSEFIERNQFEVEGNLYLQPVRDTHLNSFGFQNEPEVRGNITTVQFLFYTAFFILALAWINYVNLSTAGAAKRSREVGIRKVVGAGRMQLIIQFLSEAFLINLLAIIVAITLYQLSYSFFISITGKVIPIGMLLEKPWFIMAILLVVVFGTLLSGGYSAFMLSSFQAVKIVKGKFLTSGRGILLRKSLIVLQFIISIGLITATFSIYRQLMFMKNREKGYDISQKLILRAPRVVDETYRNRYESFKSAARNIPEVREVTASLISPGDPFSSGRNPVYRKGNPDHKILISINCVDEDYLKTYAMKFVCGRGFSRDVSSDENAVVITSNLALKLGFDPVETALQSKIVHWGQELEIIGVIDDVMMASIKKERPGVMFLLPYGERRYIGFRNWLFNYFTIDLNSVHHLPENISRIEDLYKGNFSGNPFEYFFLDNYFNDQFRAEQKYTAIFSASSVLSVFIACLGLFGLSSFMLQQRTREIGIRKVLGAPVQNILLLLSGDYLKLILLAGIIAIPLSYYGLQLWLENYIYRISLSWYLFLVPVLITMIISLVTVGYQSLKAAVINPAKVLHDE